MERDHSTRIDGFLPRDFNSHAHVERDTAQITDMQLGVNFNSHAHVERDKIKFERN